MKNNNWMFYNPTKIIFGKGAFRNLNDQIIPYKSHKNVLLICGRKALRQSGYLDKIIKQLKGKKIILIDRVEPNPEVSFVDGVIRYAAEKKVGIVIGLGGGSVIDTAKVTALLADKQYSLRAVLDNKLCIRSRKLLSIVVPTTAGAGSEVTPTSSIWEKVTGSKLSLAGESMFPDVAIIDPMLTLSLSPYQTAVTGLDALSHSVESYWSEKSSIVTRNFSLTAIKLILANLKKAFRQPKNLASREGMSLGSLYAGLAISNTGTTAAHAISYYLTARFGIAHGLACALSLPHFIRHNSRMERADFKPLIFAAGLNSMNQFAGEVKKLIGELRLPLSLKEYGITKDDLVCIKQKSFTAANIANSRIKPSKKDLELILKKML